MLCKYFLLFFRLLFISLSIPFAMQKLFSLMQCPSYLCVCAFSVSYKNSLSKLTNVKSLFLCSLLSISILLLSFIIFGLNVKIFNPFWVNFCEWCQIGAQFRFSAFGYPVHPVLSVKEIVLSPLSVPDSSVKD